MKKLLLALLPTIISRVLRARRAKQSRSRPARSRNRP
ncbi:hypothetical protein QFZ30_000293 [Arthrobacter pascens]|nr:hypothetical protein [Arthrobacter pascens]